MRLRFHIPRTGGWVFYLPGDPGRVEISYSLGRAIDVLQSAAGRVSRLMCPTHTFRESFYHVFFAHGSQAWHLVSRETVAVDRSLLPLSWLLAHADKIPAPSLE